MATDVTTPDGSSDAALAAGPRSGRARSRWATAGWYLVLTLLSVIVLFPVYMLLLRAISDPLAYVAEGQPLHPVAVEWDAFTNAFTEASLGRSMALSFVVTLVIVVAQLLTSVLAAYAFAFLEFPFRRTIFVLFLATVAGVYAQLMGGAGGQAGDKDRLADADAHQRQAGVFIGQHGIDHAMCEPPP